jgi:hypothetical protein
MGKQVFGKRDLPVGRQMQLLQAVREGNESIVHRHSCTYTTQRCLLAFMRTEIIQKCHFLKLIISETIPPKKNPKPKRKEMVLIG